MSFLYLENGEVRCTEEGMTLPEVQAIYKRDKHSAKPFFAKAITYVYFVYKPDGTFSEILYTERCKEVYNKYVKGDNLQEFVNDPEIMELGESFLDKCTTHEEKLYASWKKDVDQYLRVLGDIPYFTMHGGVQVPNITQKEEALKSATNLIKVGKTLAEMVNAGKKKSKNASIQRIFDKNEL